MTKVDRKNIIYNIIGSGLSAVSSLVFLIIVTRINGSDDSGLFTYCFATACLFYAIAVYLGRPYQVTDNSNYYQDSDYIYNRITTIIFMLICILIFSLLRGYSFNKVLLLVMLSFYKCIEAFSESLYAVIQKDNKLYKVGFGLSLKAICSYIVFLLADMISKDIYVTTAIIIVVNIILAFFYDFKMAKKSGLKLQKYSFKKNINLLKNGFYTFAFSFLSLYTLNSSRYAIDSLMTNNDQMVFGIIVMPATVMSLLSQFMIHPLLVKIKNLLQENKYIELKKNVNILLLIYFIFGILFVGICYFIGMPILHLLYGIDLSKYNSSFMLIIIGAIFYGATIMISYILIAMRKTLSQFIILVISSILALISSHILVSRYGIIGSGVNLLFIMFIEFIFYEILLITSIRGEMKK